MYRSSAMETASMILAILAAVTIWVIYLSVPLASLAVILALLSRGDRKPSGKARTSLVIAASAGILSILITVISFVIIFTNDSLHSQFNELLSYYRSYYLSSGTPSEDSGGIGVFSYFDLYGTDKSEQTEQSGQAEHTEQSGQTEQTQQSGRDSLSGSGSLFPDQNPGSFLIEGGGQA